MAEKKNKYRVRPGCRFGSYNEIGPGEVVELTAEEAAGVLDKLEPAGKQAAAQKSNPPSDKGKGKGKGSPAPGDGGKETPPQVDPVIAKVIDLTGVEAPEELSLLSDEDLKSVKGINPAVLKKIRQVYPYNPPEDD